MTPDLFERIFDELEVGATFETGDRTITSQDIALFAELTGDDHPLHTDPEWAAESEFGERIAHGLLLISFAFGMLSFAPGRALALRSIREAVFKRPAPIGTVIRAQVEVTELRPIDNGRGLVALLLKIRDDQGKLLARALIEVLWSRGRPAP